MSTSSDISDEYEECDEEFEDTTIGSSILEDESCGEYDEIEEDGNASSCESDTKITINLTTLNNNEITLEKTISLCLDSNDVGSNYDSDDENSEIKSKVLNSSNNECKLFCSNSDNNKENEDESKQVFFKYSTTNTGSSEYSDNLQNNKDLNTNNVKNNDLLDINKANDNVNEKMEEDSESEDEEYEEEESEYEEDSNLKPNSISAVLFNYIKWSKASKIDEYDYLYQNNSYDESEEESEYESEEEVEEEVKKEQEEDKCVENFENKSEEIEINEKENEEVEEENEENEEEYEEEDEAEYEEEHEDEYEEEDEDEYEEEVEDYDEKCLSLTSKNNLINNLKTPHNINIIENNDMTSKNNFIINNKYNNNNDDYFKIYPQKYNQIADKIFNQNISKEIVNDQITANGCKDAIDVSYTFSSTNEKVSNDKNENLYDFCDIFDDMRNSLEVENEILYDILIRWLMKKIKKLKQIEGEVDINYFKKLFGDNMKDIQNDYPDAFDKIYTLCMNKVRSAIANEEY